jgi:hypothetical protein
MGAEVGLPSFSLETVSRQGCDRSRSWTPWFFIRNSIRMGQVARANLNSFVSHQEARQNGTNHKSKIKVSVLSSGTPSRRDM